MNALVLALAYLRAKPLHTVLNLMLLALGTATIVLLLLFGEQLESRLTRDAGDIDMVVGAKGSPMQLILSALFHADVPTGNIPLSEAEALRANPMVASAVPLALGDNFRGYRIVGTTPDYVALYGGALAEGGLWAAPLEATVGAVVAAELGLRLGDRLVGAHGLGEGGMAHGATPYQVVGVLGPTGTVLDRLILTSVASVWAVHGLAPAHDPNEEPDAHDQPEAHDPPETNPAPATAPPGGLEITALLVKFSTPVAATSLPRAINQQTRMQAALPGYEIARLLRLVGFGIEAFRAFALVLVVSAAVGIFAALYSALSERRYDLAVMRALGATRLRIVWQILVEGLLLGGAGAAIGLVLGHGVAQLAGGWLWREHQIALSGWTWVAGEGWLLAMAVSVGMIAALLPAWQAYRIDISQTLAQG